MGITVTPSLAINAVSTAGINAPSTSSILPDAGLPIDFSALLTSQIAGLFQPENKVGITTTDQASKPDAEKDSDLIRDILFAQDPGQAAQNIIQSPPPALEKQLKINVDRNNQETLNVQAGIIPGTDPNKGTETPDSGLLELITHADKTQEKTESLIPNIAPAIESRQPISSARDTQASITTRSDTASTLLKSSTTLSQAAQQPLSLTTQTPSEATAILAGETNSGNSTPGNFATLMAGHAAQQPTQHAAPSSNPNVATQLQDNRWAQDFSERIVWIAKNDQQVAQINITPAQLGPVQITLNLNGDQASIAFASPHAEVRKAIEDAMPNLREMLSTAGISLGQSNVGAQLQQQQRDTAPQFANGNRLAGETAILPADSRSGSTPTGLPIQRGRGLVDLFA